MKIVNLSTSDIRGGAFLAAYRLHKGLQSIGMDSKMLVKTKLGDDPTVIGPQTKLQKGLGLIKPTLDLLPLHFYPKRNNVLFSPSFLPGNMATKIASLNPDVINLHWVVGGFLQPNILKHFDKPFIWTLHDMWAFTGGCHYDEECGRYRESCGKCPVLVSSKNWDLSRWIWKSKYKAWKDLDFIVVSTSRWLGECAKCSSLFHNMQVKVIPSCLDLSIFKPINKQITRELLSLPQDKKIILFGATNSTSNKRKGFHHLQSAMKVLANSEYGTEVELIVFGSSKKTSLPNLGVKTHYFGTLYDDTSLVLLYNTADAFVAPSTQENLANTVMEALACGTPCIAFNIGGMPDMIEHKRTGYLAHPFNAEDFAKGIIWILEDNERWDVLSHQARQKVEKEFDVQTVAQKYVDLYKEICE